MDLAALDAGEQLIRLLGVGNARTLVRILELPDDERLTFVCRMYQREDGQALAEILADIEEDLTGRTRERVIMGLRSAFS